MSFKIYTKTGDSGQTSLFGGKRIAKHHIRIEAYGSTDELNAHIGLLLQYDLNEGTRQQLIDVQHKLFNIGSLLATDPAKNAPIQEIQIESIQTMEQWIDQMDEHLPELKNFILPGGSLGAAQAHVCRVVCRRAERVVVALNELEGVNQQLLSYLNRLSDYFFMLSRYLTAESGGTETIWQSPK